MLERIDETDRATPADNLAGRIGAVARLLSAAQTIVEAIERWPVVETYCSSSSGGDEIAALSEVLAQAKVLQELALDDADKLR